MDARPITQQGMGLKTSHGANANAGRTIQDKSFFLGELKQRIQSILLETDYLVTENVKLEQESANFMTFDKRSQAISQELEELQGQLGDYNLMFECLQKDRDLEDLIKETAKLKVINDDKRKKVEELFFQRQKKDHQVEELEKQVALEKSKMDAMIDKMDSKTREKYLAIKQETVTLELDLADIQARLGDLEVQEKAQRKVITTQLRRSKNHSFYSLSLLEN